ncbi:MAG: helix-turn-helix transcriptional regulator [Clostridiales bacterium]|nr:helix-turn-helix transcriptional regulator [Clostridiales bacterium]
MEFGEKLQELRKSKDMTQEELAEALFVSRTAISKWESGRGYPNIESLKDISKFFSVSIDDLLSGDKLITIAQMENKKNIRSVFDLIYGIADIMAIALILLPLYPKPVGEFIYSVNLFSYTGKSQLIIFYWISFIALILVGVVKVILNLLKVEKTKPVTFISMLLSIVLVLFLAMTREAYAVAIVFLLLIIKSVLLFRMDKA